MKKNIPKSRVAQAKSHDSRSAKPNLKQSAARFSINDVIMWVLLILITLIAFYPCINNGFTNWDDPNLITENPLIKQFSSVNIKRIFTEVYFANYQPLHIFSYLIEYHFFGLNASGYHWVSVIMHMINVLLVFKIVLLLSNGNKVISFITSLLFAITPMRVESVAWAAERKDLLYSMFFFMATIAYINYLKNNLKLKFVIATFLFFVLSVFSKTMAVSFIPVMFLLDYYFGRSYNIRFLLDKIPFVALAIVMGLKAASIAKSSGSVDTDVYYNTIDRIFFACQNLLMYASKLIFPYGLSGYYQYPDLSGSQIPLSYYICGGLVFVLSIVIVMSYKRNKLLFFSAGFFVSAVALVLMIFPVGPTLFSERYSYIPSVGLYFFGVTSLFNLMNEKYKASSIIKYVLFVVIGVYVAFMVFKTRQRCEVWKDNLTFWSDVISGNPKVPIAYNNRGTDYKSQGELDKSLIDFRQAIALKQDYVEPYASMGDVFRQQGKYDSAFIYLNKAISLNNKMSQAYTNRGICYAVMNKLDSAMADFNLSIKLKPDVFEVYGNRGNLNAMLGKLNESMSDYNTALAINPDFKDAYINRGRLFYQQAKYDLAIADFNKFIQIGGKEPDAWLMCGRSYAAKNDFANALLFGNQAKVLGHPNADYFIGQWSQKKQ